MPKRRINAAIMIITIVCLAVTSTACSRKAGADGLDKDAGIIGPGADTSPDGSATSGDGANAEAAADQGDSSPDENDVGTDGITDDVDKSDPVILGSDDNAASLEPWAGDYSFTEFAPPDQNMFYSIYIYEENASYYADIYIDGFQTMQRLKAKVIGSGTRIDLLFDSYLPDNLMDIYNEGDHLLSIEKSGTKLLTIWAKIEPMLSGNNVAGGEYFEKAEYPVLLMSFIGMEESFEVIQLTDKTVTYSYYEYSDSSDPVLKERTVPFSEMLAKEGNGIDQFYISIFLYDGNNVSELELTEELTNRIKSDPEFRKKLGSLIGKHFDRQLENDVIDVGDIDT